MKNDLEGDTNRGRKPFGGNFHQFSLLFIYISF